MFKVITKMEKMYDNNMMFFFEGEFKFCQHISKENQQLVEAMVSKKEFTAKKNEILEVSFIENGNLINISFVGFGKKEEFSENLYREVTFKALNGKKGTILISSDDILLSNKDILCEILGNVNYNFDLYKEKKSEKLEAELFIQNGDTDITEAMVLNEATDIARNLIDEPANIIYPETLAEKAKEYAKRFGLEIEIFDEKKIDELGMNLLSAVGRASVKKPRVIVMRYFGDKDSNERIGLIGKGLTYDSGGLSLKPTDSMYTMKDDMSGSASVIGAMCAISKMKLKKNVIAVIGACENMINGNSYRPGDVIKSMNGKTVEIINTDAEGRLVLADVITYAVRNEKVSEVIDIATLTGAMLIALGTSTTGIFTNSDKNYSKLESASKIYGERVWRMPTFDDYAEQLESDIADIKHTGTRMGGSITAAKFLEIFAEDKPWIHIDIAGTAYNISSKWLKGKGASGIMVKTLYGYCK